MAIDSTGMLAKSRVTPLLVATGMNGPPPRGHGALLADEFGRHEYRAGQASRLI